MTYAQLITKINNEINANGIGAITGMVANGVLQAIVTNIGNIELTGIVPNNATIVDGETVLTMLSKLQGQVSAKIPASWVDTDPTLAADSDSKIPSQKAVKKFVEDTEIFRDERNAAVALFKYYHFV